MNRGPAPQPTRELSKLSLDAIAQIPNKAEAVVLLPTGAVEQHGPHLPLAVDAVLAHAWSVRALEQLPSDFPCYVAPAVLVGKSNEHAGFPGTLMLSKTTYRRLLLALARQLHLWGFRKLAVLNAHGGNTGVLEYTLQEIDHTVGLRTRLLRPKLTFDVSEQEATYGFHAGELETSWLLALAPDFVDMNKACCEYPARIDDPGALRAEGAAATFAWASQDLSRSGIMGDAPAATAEKGRRWLEAGARAYADELVHFHQEPELPAPCTT